MSSTHVQVPTTRDLLAEVASREPHEPRPAELEQNERRFVRWLLLITFGTLVVVFGILWWLDPISVTGRQTRFSVVENGGVRQAKIDLMEKLDAPPEVLVLGSSRSMKLDPTTIQDVTSNTAFNSGVSGGTTKDMYLYARYAEQLWANSDATSAEYPHLVIGLVNDVLRDDSTAALDPRLRRFLPSSQQRPAMLDQAKALMQWKTVDAAQHAVRSIVPRDGVQTLLDPEGRSGAVTTNVAVEGAQRGNQAKNFTPRGMQTFDPVRNMDIPLEKRVSAQMKVYAENAYGEGSQFTGADETGVDFLRKTIRLANSHGDVPTLWKTPFQPWGIRFLPKNEFAERDARFEEVIAELAKDPSLHFRYYPQFEDLAYFNGDPSAFYDGIHPEPANTDKVIKKLHELDAMAKPVAAPGGKLPPSEIVTD